VFYAANIYPEHVRSALDETRFLNKITGKFSMEKHYLRNMDQKLRIHIELQEKVKPSEIFAQVLQKSITTALERVNMEYSFLRQNLDKDLIPEVILHPYRDEKYFKPGLKPKYILANI
jgi:hypothetical protein